LSLHNNFDIPPGAVREIDNGEMHAETTTWTSVADLKNLRWYFKTNDDQSIRAVDLAKALAAAQGHIRLIEMDARSADRRQRAPSLVDDAVRPRRIANQDCSRLTAAHRRQDAGRPLSPRMTSVPRPRRASARRYSIDMRSAGI
jgi:Linear amide C-N hydrolases, choloylglycine hydrolase family